MSLKFKKSAILKKNRRNTDSFVKILNFDNDGLFEVEENKYTFTILISDVNYSLICEEDQNGIFNSICEVLNFLNSEDECQINIINSNIEMTSLRRRLSMDLKDDGFDRYRRELNDYLMDTCTEGSNVRKNIYITIKTEAHNQNEAKNKLTKITNGISSLLKNANARCSRLNTNNRFEILHDILRIGHEGEFKYDRNDFLTNPIDRISPYSAVFKNNYLKVGNIYGRVLKVLKNPRSIRDDFTSDLIELDINMNISIHISPISVQEAIQAADNKITACESELINSQVKAHQGNRYNWVPPRRLSKAKETAENFMELITEKDQKVFRVTYLMCHFAQSLETLNEDTNAIKNVCGKHITTVDAFHGFQEQAFLSTLPLCNNYIQPIDRVLTTEATAALSMPFNSVEFLQPNGVFMARNAVTGRPILLQRNNLSSGGSQVILARPGSGKSFKSKMEIFFEYLTNENEQILTIDPENENGPLIESLHGTQINIDVSSKTYLNPFDLIPTEDTDFIKEKCEFILILMSTMLDRKLSSAEQSVIDRYINKIYEPLIEHEFEPEYTPTLNTLREELLNSNTEEGKKIALEMEIYCSGSLNLFSHQTNIDSSNRLINFNIKKLADGLKPLAYQIILETIWNKVCLGRDKGINSFITIDEFHLLFTSEMAMNYVIKSVKRFRKYQSYCNLISQNGSELLAKTGVATLISNSSIITLMNQSSVERELLKKNLNLSDSELAYCTNSESGTGIMLIEQTPVPFDARMPDTLDIYKLLTTKPSELNLYRKIRMKKING